MAVSIPGIYVEPPLAARERPADHPLYAPHPAAFPRAPQSWYLACSSGALAPGRALGVQLCGRSLVVFRTHSGVAAALDARCPHLGSDLAAGRVVGDCIECPYHHFRFDRAGRCRGIDLRAGSYPVEERYGAVFVFLGSRATFPLPTFAQSPELMSAPPMRWRLQAQWYMAGANAFDARHFGLQHGRRLVAESAVTSPHPRALSVAYEYLIEGSSWVDRAVRRISGRSVKFQVTAWGGNLALVHARFAHDESFGLVIAEPCGPPVPGGGAARGSQVSVIVSARRSGRGVAALLADWLRVRAKRFAIRHMLEDDLIGLRQLDYVAGGLRPGDETVAAYLRWAARMPEGDTRENTNET